MIASELKLLKPCPFCGADPISDSYDRGICIMCKKCEYRRCFGGLLQKKPDYNNKAGGVRPVPKKNDKGELLKDGGENKEYYHKDANKKAIEEWNKRV